MATTVVKGEYMFRINPKNPKQLQKSRDKFLNCTNLLPMNWEAKELMVNGNELIVISTDGKMHISRDDGVNWPVTR